MPCEVETFVGGARRRRSRSKGVEHKVARKRSGSKRHRSKSHSASLKLHAGVMPVHHHRMHSRKRSHSKRRVSRSKSKRR